MRLQLNELKRITLVFFILFLSIPLIEIFLFIKISEYIGSLNTISLIILTAISGSILIKKEGIKTLDRVRKLSLHEPEKLLKALGDGFFIVVSGIFLITPGFITDFFGLTLLFKKPRNILINVLTKKFGSGGP